VAEELGTISEDPVLIEYKEKLMTNRSFFTADTVWQAAVDMGGISCKPTAVDAIGPEGGYILLGKAPDGANHAVAVRDGLLYNSLHDGPEELGDIHKTLKKVYGIYKCPQW
jgi:hypothetical protein